MYQASACSADTSAGSTCIYTDGYEPSANLFSAYAKRAPVFISTRRFCPDADHTKTLINRRRKADRLNTAGTYTCKMENGDYFTLFTDDFIDRYTVDPVHMSVKFSPAVSSFTPLISKRRNEEGDFIRLDEDYELHDLLYSVRYRYEYNVSDITAEALLQDDELERHIKSYPEMNYIEYYSQYPKFTHPVLIYQILAIAKALYTLNGRKNAEVQTVRDTAGNVVKHSVQVLDVYEGLINSASDIDWINLMYAEPSSIHQVICEVMNAAGYTNYSTVDNAVYSGVFTQKDEQGHSLYSELLDTVQKIDAIVWDNRTALKGQYPDLATYLNTLKNTEHEPTI